MRDLNISKELIKNVLVEETKNLSYDFTFDIIDNYILFTDEGECMFEVNIYEFAFKCKEWALSKDYILSSNNYNNGGCCQVIQENGEECPECGECTTFELIHSFTEVEAIIKACNWLLEHIK